MKLLGFYYKKEKEIKVNYYNLQTEDNKVVNGK